MVLELTLLAFEEFLEKLELLKFIYQNTWVEQYYVFLLLILPIKKVTNKGYFRDF